MNMTEEYQNNNLSDLEHGTNHPGITRQQFHSNMSESNNLDKIRDILFGSQIEEFDKRFTRLEERLVKEISQVRNETKQRLDTLEVYIKTEVEALTERVQNQQAEQESHFKTVTEEYKFLHTSLEKKLIQLAEQTIHNQRNLREHILSQSKALQDEIRQKSEEINKLIETEAQALRHDKADRANLAELFSEISFRLSK